MEFRVPLELCELELGKGDRLSVANAPDLAEESRDGLKEKDQRERIK